MYICNMRIAITIYTTLVSFLLLNKFRMQKSQENFLHLLKDQDTLIEQSVLLMKIL